jgi:hypothetical protein
MLLNKNFGAVNINTPKIVIFQVVTAESMKIVALWYIRMASCILVLVNRLL